MSDSNLTKIRYIEETTFGVTPATPALTELRFISTDLVHEKVTVMSEEIRADRGRNDLVQVGKNVSGNLETEFLVGAYDDLILGALMAAGWTEEVGTALDAEIASNVITLNAGTFSAAVQGAQYVKIGGLTVASEDGIYRIASCTDTVMTIGAEKTLTDEAGAGPDVTVKYARQGTTNRSFFFETEFTSLTPAAFIPMNGLAVASWNLAMEAQARLMTTFEMMGTSGGATTPATAGVGNLPASTASICNTSDNIGSLIWDGSASTYNVMSLDFTLTNNLRNRLAISRDSTLEHGKGRSEPDGTMEVYFETAELYNIFFNHGRAALHLPIVDPDGNHISIHLPHLKFPTGAPAIEGVNTDLMLPLEFNALRDETLEYVIQVDRLDA